jgi:RNA polymerase sigma factor (sigma-70 family)
VSDFAGGGCLIGEMQAKSDAALLRQYAGQADEAAFCEIVVRHTDLVYASALRQVGVPDLARDIAQSVFTDLARKAPSLAGALPENASLVGWLYRGARFAALNQLRDDRRRQARERQVMQHFDPASDTAPEWDQVQPVLDEAMADLSDEDRDALLLRFFKSYDFRAIGAAFGVSDDAAQKRVTRALERLRTHLTSRGLTTTAAALSAVISTNAVPLAPAGLAATLSTSALAGTTIATTATATAVKTIAMTTLQKTIITAALVAAAGTGVYEARQVSQLREQVQALQQQQAPLTEQIQQMQRERDDATNRLTSLVDENATLKRTPTELLKLRSEVTRLRADSNDPADTAAKGLLARVNKLKQRLQETPDARIPELQLLTEQDWLKAASGNLETDADYRRALAALRSAAENRFGSMLQPALKRYAQANDGHFPTDLAQLQPSFDSPVDDAMLQRWNIVAAKTVPNVQVGGDWIITQKAPVDDVFDTRFVIGPNGSGSTDFLSSEIGNTMIPVVKAFSAANNGKEPTDVSQLLPYGTTPDQQAAVQKMIQRQKAAAK